MERRDHERVTSVHNIRLLIGEGTENDPVVNVAVRIYGEEYKTNEVICLAGGPGFSAIGKDLAPFADFARIHERTTVVVDMPGTGMSILPGQDKKKGEEGYRDYSHLWTIEQHVKWLDAIRLGLGTEKPDLLGNSWGAMLAFEYALSHPENIRSIIAIGAMESISDYQRDSVQHLLEIHPNALEIIKAYETSDDEGKKIYKPLLDAIETTLTRRHGLGVRMQLLPEARENWEVQYKKWRRMSPDERREIGDHSQFLIPSALMESGEEFEQYGHAIFDVMVGKGVFAPIFPTGNLKNHERLEVLSNLDPRIRVLVMVGEHDEMSPRAAADINRTIPNSELVVVPGAAHLGFWENPEEYFKAIDKHLKVVDASV